MGNNFVINNSFQLIRTNPLLTTNLQIIVDSSYNLYLESINSHKWLNVDKFKHFSITKYSLLEDKIPEFYQGLPINIAYYVKFDSDDDIIYIVYYFEMIDQEQLDKYILPLIEYINTQGYSEYSEWSIFGGKDRKNNTDQFYVTTEIRLLSGDPFYKFIKDIRREKSTKRFGL